MARCSNSCNSNSNSSSACALRKILNSLDDLTTQDLETLSDVIDRILDCNC